MRGGQGLTAGSRKRKVEAEKGYLAQGVNMRLRKKTWYFISVLVTSLALVGFTGGVAQAAQTEICGNAGTGYCLNDWNDGGNGNAVKMYYGGNSNEDFYAVQVTSWCNHGKVDLSCPFTHAALDKMYNGDVIFEIDYGPGTSELCVGVDQYADAVLANKCPSVDATPSNGTVFVQPKTPCGTGPGGAPATYAVNRYESDVAGSTSYLRSGGNPGVQAYFSATPTCFGQG